MIRSLLEQLILDTEDCIAAILVAPDGMAVDSVVVDGRVDTELLAAGAADLIRRCESFVEEAGTPPLQELALTAGPMTFVLRAAGEGHRLLAVLDGDAGPGAVRQALIGAVQRLADDLSLEQPRRGSLPAGRVDPVPRPGV